MEKEREIYIRDLLLYICQKWKRILMWMILFAVLMGGVGAVKSYKEMTAARQEQNEGDDGLSAYKAEMSEKDIKKVDETYDLYLTYDKTLKNSKEYYDNSLKMNMDPNEVPTIFMQYRINNTKKIPDIVMAYSNMVLDEESCANIKEISGIDTNTRYIGELIKFNTDDSHTQKTGMEEKIEEENMSTSMLIQIIAPSQQMCEAIADAVETEIQSQTKLLKDKLGVFDILQVGRNYVKRADSDLLREQQDCITQISSINSIIDALSTSLDEKQKEYFKSLINKENNQQESGIEEIKYQTIDLKYIIVGLVIGLFVSFGWYGISYIVNPYLRTIQDMEEYYEVPVLEVFCNKKNNRVINALFHTNDGRSKNKKIDMVYASIKAYMDKRNMQKIHFTGSVFSEDVEEIVDEIIKKLKNDHYEVTTGKAIITDVESLNDAVNAEEIVLVEEVGKSDFKEIGREIEICKRNGTGILGAIVIF